MTTARKTRWASRSLQAARATVEMLEQRQLLTAGQLDYSWYDPGNVGGSTNVYGYINDATRDQLIGNAYQPFDTSTIGPNDSGYPLGDYIDLRTGLDNRIIATLVDDSGKVVVVGHSIARTGFVATFNDASHVPANVGYFYGFIVHDDIYVARYYPNGELERVAFQGIRTIDGSGDWGNNGQYDFGNIGGFPSPADNPVIPGRGVGLAQDELDDQINDPDTWSTLIYRYNDEAVTAAIDPRNGDIVVIGRKIQDVSQQNTEAYQYYMRRYGAATLTATGAAVALDISGAGPGTDVGDINDMRILADGSFVLVGQSYATNADYVASFSNLTTGFYTVATRFDAAGARLNTLTAPTFNSYSDDRFLSVDVDDRHTADVSDDRIYVVGTTDDRTWDAIDGKQRLIVLRYDINGTIDNTFGWNADAELEDFGGKNVIGVEVKAQTDGRIDVLGQVDQLADPGGAVDTTVIARFNTDGTLDSSFIGGGRAYIPKTNWFGTHLAIETNGGIIVSGINSLGNIEATRLDLTGRLDTSYGFLGYGQLDVPVNFVDQDPYTFWPDFLESRFPTHLTINRGPNGIGDDKAFVGWNHNPATFTIARLLTTNQAPTANLQAPDVYTAYTSYIFTVTYTDDEFVSIASLGALNSFATYLHVLNPSGTAVAAPITIIGITPMTRPTDITTYAKSVSVTYSVNIGAGGFTPNGLYTITIDGNVIRDTNRDIYPPTEGTLAMSARTLGGFTVAVGVPDTTPPTIDFNYNKAAGGTASGGTTTKLVDQAARWVTNQWNGATVNIISGPGNGRALTVASMERSDPTTPWYDTLVFASDIGFVPDVFTNYTLSKAANDIVPGITVRGRSYFDFNVVYEDPIPGSVVNVALLDGSDLQVVGPRGYVQLAQLLPGSMKLLDAYRKVQVTYRVLAPGATTANDYARPWDSTDNGLYRIYMQANQVADTATVPNYMQAREVGQFNVAVNDATTVYPQVTSITISPDQDGIPTNGTQVKASRAVVTIVAEFAASPHSTGYIDPTSGFANALRVTNSGGFNQIATLVPGSLTFDVTKNVYRATYTVSPADGSWDLADNATYTVSLQANTIRDTENPANFNQAATLGAFGISIVPGQDARPSAQVVQIDAGNPITASRGTISFVVEFDPSIWGVGPVQANGLGSAITVVGPGGVVIPVTYYATTLTGTPGGGLVARYSITPADGSWDDLDNGLYTIKLVGGIVSDSDVPPNVARAADIGNVTVNIVAPGQWGRPTAQLSPVSDILNAQGALTFTVTFVASSDAPINPNTGFASAITVTNPSNVTTQATLVSKTLVGNNWVCTYSYAPADGTFDGADSGNYTVSVVADTVYDLQPVPESVPGGALAPGFVVNIEDVTLPRVTAVYARGSFWASNYLSFLAANLPGSSATYGYAIPVGSGAAQLQTLPWRNLNRISLAFSEDVTVAQAQFAIVGSVGSYSVSGFAYSSADHVATWSLSAAIGPDKLYVALPGTGGGPITDAAGNVLDGEWNNPSSYSDVSSTDTFPSGNGVAGGDFAFRFDVLPGDSSGGSLGKVNVADALQTKGRSGLPVTVSTYRSDFDGNSLINVADVLYVKSKSSVYSLPVNPPVVPVFGSLSSQVSLLQKGRLSYLW